MMACATDVYAEARPPTCGPSTDLFDRSGIDKHSKAGG
jgi:hypothetical protein